MQQESDVQLLLRYARQGEESAFGDIVARHADLVYSAALRQVGSADLARDVAQSVFSDLARKARTLCERFHTDASLVGWLYRSTRFAALTELRSRRRRLAVESNVMDHLGPAPDTSEPNLNWDRILPLLDELMSSLGEEDRDALLLRFFKNQDFRTVGVALGVSDDAAQKRVTRALERLRKLLARRGITISSAVLSAIISTNAVQAVPAGLVAALTGTAISATAVAPVALAAAKLFAMTTIQKSVIGVALAAAVGTGLHEARRAYRLDDQLQALQQQQGPLADKNRQIQKERDEALRQLVALRKENERLNRDANEVLKLRAEVGRLYRESKPNASGASDPTDVAAQEWVSRVKTLKQRFDQWPGKKTRELQLLTEQDWLDEGAAHQLASEEDCRQAMSELRFKAMHKFSEAINQALKKFAGASNQTFPSDPSDLSSFLDPAANACLSSWDAAKPGWVHPPQPAGTDSETAAVWALIEKGSFTPDGIPIRDGSYLADPDYDMTVVIYNGGCFGYGPDKPSK